MFKNVSSVLAYLPGGASPQRLAVILHLPLLIALADSAHHRLHRLSTLLPILLGLHSPHLILETYQGSTPPESGVLLMTSRSNAPDLKDLRLKRDDTKVTLNNNPKTDGPRRALREI